MSNLAGVVLTIIKVIHVIVAQPAKVFGFWILRFPLSNEGNKRRIKPNPGFPPKL